MALKMDIAEHHHLGNKLKFAILLTGVILVGELVGGFLANSLALLSDAGHMFSDVLALSLSWFGVRQAAKPPTHRMTYGYHRVGILIALINALTIFLIAGVILYEAYHRLRNPEPVEGLLMFGVAVVGLGANLFVVHRLHADQKRNLNVRSAFLHAMGDALASVGVIVGGLIIFFTSWFLVDPAISVFIALIITFSAWKILKEGVGIFLEASPKHLDMEELAQAITGVPGVGALHDLHVWSLDSQRHALSCHIQLENSFFDQRTGVMEKLNKLLLERFDISHSTVQLECVGCDFDALYCSPQGCSFEGEHSSDKEIGEGSIETH